MATVAFVTFLMVLGCVSAVPSIDSQPNSCSSGKLDLVLVVDVSGSNERRFEANRDAALDIARAMPIGWDKTVIAVIQYSKLAIMKLQFGSSQTAEIVNETISTLEWPGGVALSAEAMDLAMIQFRRSRNDADRVIILFSDGNSLNSWSEVQATSERLRYSKAKIYAVSLGGSTYEPELKSYIGSSNGSIISRQSELAVLKKELLQYTVSGCHSSFAKPAAKPSEGSQEEEHKIASAVKSNEPAAHGKQNATHHTSPPLKAVTSKTTARTTKKMMAHTNLPQTTPHPPGSRPPTADKAVAPTKLAATTATPDVFDPAARQDAIEKMIDRAVAAHS